MKNLLRFCHFTEGSHQEKAIKILGAFIALLSLASLTFSFEYSANAERAIVFEAGLLQEHTISATLASANALPQGDAGIEGFVYDTDGTPLGSIEVLLVTSGADAVTGKTMTDASGKFRFEKIAAGGYLLNAVSIPGRQDIIPPESLVAYIPAEAAQVYSYVIKFKKTIVPKVPNTQSGEGITISQGIQSETPQNNACPAIQNPENCPTGQAFAKKTDEKGCTTVYCAVVSQERKICPELTVKCDYGYEYDQSNGCMLNVCKQINIEPRKENKIKEEQRPIIPIEELEESAQQEYVNPEDVKNALRDIKNMKQEIRRLIASLKKAKSATHSMADSAELESIQATIIESDAEIRKRYAEQDNGLLRSALSSFWEGQYWDTMNKIRARIDLPRELNNIERDLNNLRKALVTQIGVKEKKRAKNIKSALGFFEIDRREIDAAFADMSASHADAKQLYKNEQYDEAQEALSDIHEGGHPGELLGILNRLSEFYERLNKTKSKDVQKKFKELFLPIIYEINSGEFRDANQLLNEISAAVFRVLDRAYALRGKQFGALNAKLKELENLIQTKLESLEPEQEEKK